MAPSYHDQSQHPEGSTACHFVVGTKGGLVNPPRSCAAQTSIISWMPISLTLALYVFETSCCSGMTSSLDPILIHTIGKGLKRNIPTTTILLLSCCWLILAMRSLEVSHRANVGQTGQGKREVGCANVGKFSG